MTIQRFLVYAFLGLILGLFEASTSTFLPSGLSAFHPTLPLIAYLVLFQRTKPALICAFVSGIVVDLFFAQTVFAILEFPLMSMVLEYAALTLFTNQSIYAAIAMVICARLANWIWIEILWLGNRWISGSFSHPSSGKELLLTLGWDSALMGVLFLCGALFFQRFFDRTHGRSSV